MSSISHQLLVAKGVELSNELHRFVTDGGCSACTTNPVKGWNNKLFVLALLAYAVSMGKFSDLDRDDFIKLCEGFYDNIEVNLHESQDSN